MQVVYGPGTFINSAVGEIQDQLRAQLDAKGAEAERAAAAARAARPPPGQVGGGAGPARRARPSSSSTPQFVRDLLQLNLKYGLGVDQTPRLDDPDFVATLVFDPEPRRDDAEGALRLPVPVVGVGGDPGAAEARAVGRASASGRPRWCARRCGCRTSRCATREGYTVTGVPVLAEDLSDALAGSVARLLVVAVVVMAARARARVPAPAAARAARRRARRRGAHVRADGAGRRAADDGVDRRAAGAARARASTTRSSTRRGSRTRRRRAARAAAARVGRADDRDRGARHRGGLPRAAALAGADGARVRRAARGRRRRGVRVRAHRRDRGAGGARRGAAAAGPLARSARGAGELLAAAARPLARLAAPRSGRLGAGVLRAALRAPGPRRRGRRSPSPRSAGSSTRRPRCARTCRRSCRRTCRRCATSTRCSARPGVAGEVDVVVEGRDLTDPEVVAWMRALPGARAEATRATAPENGCGKAALCPALSLPDLFQGDGAASDRAKVDALLDAVPPYFSQAVITADRRTANLAFGIRLMPLDEQHAVIERMRAALDPPAGVTARVAGLPVLAAEANAALASPWRRLGTLLAGLLAVGLVLLAVPPARRARVGAARADRAGDGLVGARAVRAADPAQPDVGDARRARDRDLDRVRRAARRALPGGAGGGPRAGGGAAAHLRSTGAAVLASGATAIAGFAVLAFSDVRMLQEFGIVTVVDLSVSLLGVLAVLPGGARAGRAARGGARGARRGAAPARPCRREGRLARRRGRRRRARLHHAQHAAHRGRSTRAAWSRARGCRRSRCRSRRSGLRRDANVAAARQRPRARWLRVRGPDVLNVVRAGRAGPGRARVRGDRAPATARTRSTCSTASRRASRASRSPPSRCAGTTDELRALVRERGWRVPVGYDHDGAVANRYGLGVVCPLLTFARRDGRVAGTRARRARRGARSTRARQALADGRRPPRDERPGSRAGRGRDRSARRGGAPRAARVDRAHRRAGRGGRRPSCASGSRLARRPLPRRRRRSRCAPGRCRGRTACCSATSGSIPTSRARRSRRSSLERLLHGGFAAHGLPGGRARARHAGDRRAGLGGRRRPGRRARAGAGRRRPARARRRGGPGRGAVRAARCRSGRRRARTRALLLDRGAGARGRGHRSSRRRCGRRPPRSIPLTLRHDRSRPLALARLACSPSRPRGGRTRRRSTSSTAR